MEGAVIVFEDEASFRQTPTLHATWARLGSQPQIPTRGERHTQKIFTGFPQEFKKKWLEI